MTQVPALAVVRRQVIPVYAAGFVTAFGAHAVAANLGRYALGRHGSLWEVGLLLGIYDGAEVVLKPVFGALADRTGAKPVMTGGLAEPGHNLDDRSAAAAGRMPEAGGATHRAGVRLPRRVMCTKAALFRANEYGVMAALGQRTR